LCLAQIVNGAAVIAYAFKDIAKIATKTVLKYSGYTTPNAHYLTIH